MHLPKVVVILLWDIYPREILTYVYMEMYHRIFIVAGL